MATERQTVSNSFAGLDFDRDICSVFLISTANSIGAYIVNLKVSF